MRRRKKGRLRGIWTKTKDVTNHFIFSSGSNSIACSSLKILTLMQTLSERYQAYVRECICDIYISSNTLYRFLISCIQKDIFLKKKKKGLKCLCTCLDDCLSMQIHNALFHADYCSDKLHIHNLLYARIIYPLRSFIYNC